MSLITRIRKQKAILWKFVGSDQYGAGTYETPVEITCRWSAGETQKVTRDGVEVDVTTKVYVPEKYPLDSRLILADRATMGPLLGLSEGDAAEESIETLISEIITEFPAPPAIARPILQSRETPNFRATETLCAAML